MKNYAVIQHNYSEFLGQIERQLEVRDIGFSYFRPFVGQDLPGSALHFDALFLLGGSNPPLDDENNPWLTSEKYLVRQFLDKNRPVVGFGYGALVIAQCFGAKCEAEPLQTAYWTTAHKTASGEGDPVAESLHEQQVLVMYNGSANLPDALEPILVDDMGNWLAIKPAELCYGFLLRPELKPGMLEDMVMEAHRETPDNIGEILAEARAQWGASQETTDRFIVALVKSLNLMQERKKVPVFNLKVESDDGK